MQFVLNVPNVLTLLRMFLGTVLLPQLLVLFLPRRLYYASLCLAVLFALVALTDFADGYLARRHHQMTEFGSMLDPLADKVFVMGILVALVSIGRVPHWLAIVLLGREFFVMWLREIALLSGTTIPVLWAGKLKTFLQLCYLGVVIANTHFYVCDAARWLERTLLLLAAGITIYSALYYILFYLMPVR